MKKFIAFTARTSIAHTITYIICGMIASTLFNYKTFFESDVLKDFMKPINSSSTYLGPFAQPLRGALFSIAIYPLRDSFIRMKYGWCKLWVLIVCIGMLSTPGPCIGSIEGIIYSKVPFWAHFVGMPEVYTQTLLFSILVVHWEKYIEGRVEGFLFVWFIECIKYFGLLGIFAVSFSIAGIISAIFMGQSVQEMINRPDANWILLFFLFLILIATVISKFKSLFTKFVIYIVAMSVGTLVTLDVHFVNFIANLIPILVIVAYTHAVWKK